jgi:hypothetical protein
VLLRRSAVSGIKLSRPRGAATDLVRHAWAIVSKGAFDKEATLTRTDDAGAGVPVGTSC